MKYNSLPLGQLPKEFKRTEPDKIKELGYNWQDPRDIIEIFEDKVAKFAGSAYALSCDCCTHGIFLVLKYLNKKCDITVPKQTYVSIPMTIKHAGYGISFKDIEWDGYYKLEPLEIYDGAGMWKKNMYLGGFHVLSFQIKKTVPIGRGGMILTDDKEAYNLLKLMSYDGRDLKLPYDHPEHIKCDGYHYYMTPEDAARGIILMDSVPEENPNSYNYKMYPDLSKIKI